MRMAPLCWSRWCWIVVLISELSANYTHSYRKLLSVSEYRTLSDGNKWADDYALVPPNSMGWTVLDGDGSDYTTVTASTWSGFSYYGPFSGDSSGDTTETFTISQYFQCAVRSSVSVSYSITFCNTESEDYVHMYVDDTVQQENSLDEDDCDDDGCIQVWDWNFASAADCDWDELTAFRNLGPFPYPAVDANTLFEVRFEIGTTHSGEGIGITEVSITCNAIPTPEPTTEPPTTLPSRSPTIFPTETPTTFPTTIPTQYPSESTLYPTTNPTAEPTLEPTQIPSNLPSIQPTLTPTNVPTAPSSAPSSSPTQRPFGLQVNDDGSVGVVDEEEATDQQTPTPNINGVGLEEDNTPNLQLDRVRYVVVGFTFAGICFCCCILIAFAVRRSRKNHGFKTTGIPSKIKRHRIAHIKVNALSPVNSISVGPNSPNASNPRDSVSLSIMNGSKQSAPFQPSVLNVTPFQLEEYENSNEGLDHIRNDMDIVDDVNEMDIAMTSLGTNSRSTFGNNGTVCGLSMEMAAEDMDNIATLNGRGSGTEIVREMSDPVSMVDDIVITPYEPDKVFAMNLENDMAVNDAVMDDIVGHMATPRHDDDVDLII